MTKDALRKRNSRAKETLEETCNRRSKAATGMARFRANLSDDEKKKRKEANAARMRQAREKEKSKKSTIKLRDRILSKGIIPCKKEKTD